MKEASSGPLAALRCGENLTESWAGGMISVVYGDLEQHLIERGK